MTKIKRFLSCFLAFTMVLGMFSGMGAMFAVDASAAEGTTQVKTYDDLKDQYGDFIYYGIDVMEIVDGTETYTDFYVNAGDTLKILHYIKSTRYTSSFDLYLEADSDFFDVSNNGVDYESALMPVNASHPGLGAFFYAGLTTSDLMAEFLYTDFGYDEDYTAKIDSIGFIGGIDDTKTDVASTMTSDLYAFEQTIKVKEGLANGTTGRIGTIDKFWMYTDIDNTDITCDVKHTDFTVDDESSASISDTDWIYEYWVDNFILDVERTFTIGANPDEGGNEGGSTGGPVVGTTQVKTYDDLKDQYGDFIYYGIDVMEIVDGTETYTDFYVNAGDTLKILHYIKSTRYTSSFDLYLEADSDFFDVSNNGVDYESALMPVNASHPGLGAFFYAGLTTSDLMAEFLYTDFGYDEDYTAKIDSIGFIGGIDDTKTDVASTMTSDLYAFEQTIKVKEGLANGTTGRIGTIDKFWMYTDIDNTDITCDVKHTDFTVDDETSASIGDTDWIYEYWVDNFILDVERTFTIGANPNQGGGSDEPSDEPVETVSQVKTYDDLKDQYGDFIYYGIDVMEIVDGTETYTDFYVNAGDTLKILHYIKSTRYTSSFDLYLEADSDFFDVSNNGVDYESALMPVNASHPGLGAFFYAGLTTSDLMAEFLYTDFGYDEDYTAKIDSIGFIGGIDDTKTDVASTMTSDLYAFEQTIKVKEGLANGTTGRIGTIDKFWMYTDIDNTDITCDVKHTDFTVDDESSASIGDTDWIYEYWVDNFILDVERTFTIGKAPSAGSKNTATFKDGDTVISSEKYAAGATIATPEALSKENAQFVGWALEGTTNVLSSFVMGGSDVTYVAIWKYAAIFMVEGEVHKTDYYLPGDQINIPAVPDKAGYSGKWDKSTSEMGNEPITFTADYTAKTYTVTYKSAAGTKTARVKFGAAYPTTTLSTAKEGYVFLGWFLNGNEVKLGVDKHNIAADVTIEAKYELGKYTATFKANGGIFEDGKDTYKTPSIQYGSAITPPKDPTRTGYTFGGWNPTVGNMGSADMEFVAKWNPISITYKFMDGERELQTITGIYLDPVDPNVPTKEGYTFAGWKDASGNTLTFPTTIGTEDVTAYAQWNAKDITLTFTFKAEDGGNSTFYQTKTLKAGSEMNVPDSIPPVSGKEFAGWVDENGDPIPETVPTKNTTYYASFSAAMYTVTFYDANGGIISTDTLAAGSTIQKPANDPVKEGHKFGYWVNKETGTEVTFPHTLARDIEIEPFFTLQSYTITWTIDGEIVHTQTVPYGTTFTDFEPNVPSGKTFQGWEEHSNVMPAHDITINGSYDTVLYKITFNINGVFHAEKKFAAGVVPTAPDYVAPEGHDFSGWTLPSKMPTRDVVVDATLEIHQYTVEFYTYEGKQGPLGSQILNYGDEINYPSAPVIAGKDFKGWNPEYTTMPALETNGDILVVTAILVDHAYNIKFIGFNDVVVDETTNTYNKQVNAIDAPKVEGYTFKYWTLNDKEAKFPVTVKSDLTFKAYYEINTHKVTYILDGEVYQENTYSYGTNLPDAPKVNVEGYNFSGWSPETPATMPDEDVVIEGKLTPVNYDAKFFQEDGATQIGDAVSTAFGTSPVAPTDDMIPEKPGYTFMGWKLIGGDDTVYASDKLPAMVVGGASYKAYYSAGVVNYNVTIYVMDTNGEYDNGTTETLQGEADKETTYPVEEREGFTIDEEKSIYSGKLDANGNTEFKIYYIRNQYTITYKSVVWEKDVVNTYYFGEKVEEIAAPDMEGYTNNGWNVAIPETMTAGDIVATAQYAINDYTITFNTDGGSNVGSITAKFGEDITAPTAPTKEGHAFLYWTLDGEKYTIPNKMPAKNMTLVAEWETLKFTITFVTDDGEEIAVINDYFGTTIEKPTAPDKEGYTFDNWTPAIPDTVPAQNLTITANYKVISYDATFIIDGKEVKISTEFGKAPAAPTATKYGHKFAGWLAADGNVYASDALPVMVVGGATYEAKFDALEWPATFQLDGGNIDGNTADVVVNTLFNKEIKAPVEPKKDGYKFAGWLPAELVMDAEGKTFVAQWTQDLEFCRVQSVKRVTTPVYGITFAAYEIEVMGSPIKLQIAEMNDNGTANITWTYDRIEFEYGETVEMEGNVPSDVGLISIKAYNAAKEEVAYGSEDTAYEIWTVSASLAEGAHKVRAKVDTSAESWEKLAYGKDFNMKYDEAPKPVDMIKSADISNATIVRGDATTLTIKTDATVNRIRLQLDKNTFVTYTPKTAPAVQYSVADGEATWVINVIFTYEGNDAEVKQTWDIYYRVEGSNTYIKGEDDDKYDITIVRFKEVESPVEGQDPFSIISVAAADEVVRAKYTEITIVTTDDVTKLRLVNGSRASTFIDGSNNVTRTENGDGTATWVIRYRFATIGEQTWNVLCRGNAWSEANAEDAFTINVKTA